MISLIMIVAIAQAQYIKQFLTDLQDLTIFTSQPQVYSCSILNYDFILMNMQNTSVTLNTSLDHAHYYIHIYVDYFFLGQWQGESVQVSINNTIINEYNYTSTATSDSGLICSEQAPQKRMTHEFELFHIDDLLVMQFKLVKNQLSKDVEFPFQLGIRNIQVNISTCHSTCQTCSGPLETDCRQCPANSNKSRLNNTCKCQLNLPYISSGACVPFCQRNSFPDMFNNCNSNTQVINAESSLYSTFDYGQNNKTSLWGMDINGTTRSQLLFIHNDNHLFGLFKEKQTLNIRLGSLQGHYKLRIKFNLYFFYTWAVGEYVLTTIDQIKQQPYIQTINGITNLNTISDCSNLEITQCKMATIEHYQIHTSEDLLIQIYSDAYSQSICRWAISMFSVDILQCSNKCQSCDNNYACSSCFKGFFLHQNQCVSSCPLEYSVESNGKCLELDQQIIQSQQIFRALMATNLQGTEPNNTCYFNGYRHFGGLSQNSPSLYRKIFTDLQPHYQIRASFKIDLMNIQSSSGYVAISLDDERQRFDTDPSKLIQQTILNLTFPHSKHTLRFEILQSSQATIPYFKSGVSNMIIAIDYCFPTCTACNGPNKEDCLQWSVEPNFDRITLMCTDSTYLVNNTCVKCNSKCNKCNQYNQCTQCQGEYTLSGYECYCRTGYYSDSNQNCQKCFGSCQGCTGPNQQDCYELSQQQIICDISKGFQWGQECNDGNYVIRDGCSNCIIDLGWSCINVIGQYSVCLKCPENCANCQIKNGEMQCLECKTGYFYYQTGCFQCKSGCAACNYIDQCTQCQVQTIIPLNGKCEQCKEEAGFYEVDGVCKSKCGDFRQTDDEECDDGNLINGDGCSFDCKIEKGFSCLNGICDIVVEKAKIDLKYSNKTTTNTLKLNFGDYPAKCDEKYLTVYLENFEAKDFKVFLKLVTQNAEKFCQISFKFYRNVRDYDMIHVLFYKNKQRLLLDVEEMVIQARSETYYSDDDQVVAQQIYEMQNSLVSALYFIGPATILLGGFNFFFSILDILAWLNNFYYINVMYPPNVNILFLNPAWSIINPFDFTPIERHEGDIDYIESPFRFEQKGVDPYFLNNMMMCFVTWMLVATLYPLCKFTVMGIERYFQRSPQQKIKIIQTKQMPIFSLDQSIQSQQPEIETKIENPRKYPSIIQYIYDNAFEYQISFRAIMIKQLNLIYLDLCMASILQLQYISKSSQILIFSQVFLSVIGLGLCIIIFIIAINVSKQSSLLLNTKQYKYDYGTLYEGINVESEISKIYFSISFARKMLFIIFLVGLYNYPLFQTSFCCAASFLNLMLLIYQNPFESKIEYIQNAVPDATIFFVLIVCVVFAYDDKEQEYTATTRTNLGWLILSFIGISVLTQLLLIIRQYIIDLKSKFEWLKGKICKK